MNKIDLVSPQTLKEIKSKINYDYIPISAETNINIDILKEKIYQKLDFIRVFMRPKGEETDYEDIKQLAGIFRVGINSCKLIVENMFFSI